MILLIASLLLTAEPDFDDRVERDAPTRISVGLSDFGQMPEARSATRLLVGGRALLLVDNPNLFGTISVDVNLRATFAITDRVWVSAGLAAFEMRNVINASIAPTQLGLGALTTAVHLDAVKSSRLSISPYVKLLWPTASNYNFARPFGFEVGVSSAYELHRMLSILGGLMLPTLVTGLGDRTNTTLTPALAVELALHPWRWFDLLAGVEMRLGLDPKSAFEYVAPKFALRFYPVSGFLVELKGMLPLGGIERTDYVFGGAIGWVFDKPKPAPPRVVVLPMSMPTSEPASQPASIATPD